MKVTVFGATGVVGRALLPLLAEHEVTAVSRTSRDDAGARWVGRPAKGGNWFGGDGIRPGGCYRITVEGRRSSRMSSAGLAASDHDHRRCIDAALRKAADGWGVHLVEDAACAAGSTAYGQPAGTGAAVAAWSFHPRKLLTTGEGGMVTLASADHADWMRVAALHGLSRDAWARYAPGAQAPYDVVMPGYKYNMMDLQAALGLAQLARLGEMQAQRAVLWDRYEAGLAHLPLGRPAPVPDGWTHARHLYTVIVDPHRCGWTRDALQAALGSHARHRAAQPRRFETIARLQVVQH